MDSFDILKVLGKGYHGKVMMWCKKLTGEIYVIETVHKSRLIKTDKMSTFFGECNTLMRARHPFIVQMYFAFQTDTKFYLGLEFVSGGELFHHLCDLGPLPTAEVRLYIALNYLHGLNILYRDLKPENMMLDTDEHIKITDFGLAKQISPQSPTSATFCGTPEYLANQAKM
jgi:serine/threonine protein kinase